MCVVLCVCVYVVLFSFVCYRVSGGISSFISYQHPIQISDPLVDFSFTTGNQEKRVNARRPPASGINMVESKVLCELLL